MRKVSFVVLALAGAVSLVSPVLAREGSLPASAITRPASRDADPTDFMRAVRPICESQVRRMEQGLRYDLDAQLDARRIPDSAQVRIKDACLAYLMGALRARGLNK